MAGRGDSRCFTPGSATNVSPFFAVCGLRRHDHDDVRLGVWVTNQKSRRDKLSGEQLAQLAELGMYWT
ncbi:MULTISPECIES: helicase associated domain-containing protein [unclassified Streptomyces]|uniref:helicase associated domain-containing protein n=1 Tax=unclassified Streptomyces TaxID=2593676 RepID=UPI00380989DD